MVVLLSRQIKSLQAFSDDADIGCGVIFGEGAVIYFCLLCFHFGELAELSGVAGAAGGLGVSSFSGGGGKSFVCPLFLQKGGILRHPRWIPFPRCCWFRWRRFVLPVVGLLVGGGGLFFLSTTAQVGGRCSFSDNDAFRCVRALVYAASPRIGAPCVVWRWTLAGSGLSSPARSTGRCLGGDVESVLEIWGCTL
ncbi:hypothetical protein PVAP13_3KG282700 [Panicum virgatum]|uniref:Uncharacterized protein n=1 Tax=Panicum virgatum TaxID=38727 RepID=A0A8T0UZ37_PANVG|nr:hypothetical protein PVAP13_3KG282700 [Panicum virgatum]